MRENFDLTTPIGRANFFRRLDRWAVRHAAHDTWNGLVCLARGHDFSDAACGSPWCQRCHIATRPVPVRARD